MVIIPRLVPAANWQREESYRWYMYLVEAVPTKREEYQGQTTGRYPNTTGAGFVTSQRASVTKLPRLSTCWGKQFNAVSLPPMTQIRSIREGRSSIMEEPYSSDVVSMPTIPPRRSAGTRAGIYPDDEKSYLTNETVTTRRRPLADDYDDEPGRSRLPRSSVRRSATTQAAQGQPTRHIHIVKHPPQQRASRLPVPVPQKQVERRNIKIHLSWQAWLIVITILLVGGWLLVNILLSVLHTVSDNVTYGNPRTFHADKDVGHGGVSHFVAMNLDGHIIVVEIVNHEISTTKVYSIITLSGDGASLAPVTLSFQAMTTPSTLDMVVSVDNGQYVWSNDGKQFQAKTGGS